MVVSEVRLRLDGELSCRLKFHIRFDRHRRRLRVLHVGGRTAELELRGCGAPARGRAEHAGKRISHLAEGEVRPKIHDLHLDAVVAHGGLCADLEGFRLVRRAHVCRPRRREARAEIRLGRSVELRDIHRERDVARGRRIRFSVRLDAVRLLGLHGHLGGAQSIRAGRADRRAVGNGNVCPCIQVRIDKARLRRLRRRSSRLHAGIHFKVARCGELQFAVGCKRPLDLHGTRVLHAHRSGGDHRDRFGRAPIEEVLKPGLVAHLEVGVRLALKGEPLHTGHFGLFAYRNPRVGRHIHIFDRARINRHKSALDSLERLPDEARRMVNNIEGSSLGSQVSFGAHGA